MLGWMKNCGTCRHIAGLHASLLSLRRVSMASQIPESWSVHVAGYLWTHLHVAAFHASLLTLAHVDNDSQDCKNALL